MMTKCRRQSIPLAFKVPSFYPSYRGTQLSSLVFIPARKYRLKKAKTFVIKNRLIKLLNVPKPYHLPTDDTGKQLNYKTLTFNKISRIRPQSIKIRLSDSELYHLKNKAKKRGMTVAAYMREYALSLEDPVLKRTPAKLDKQFIRLFAGACNNLNQLVHLLHIDQKRFVTVDYLQLIVDVQEMNELLYQIYGEAQQISHQLIASKNPTTNQNNNQLC